MHYYNEACMNHPSIILLIDVESGNIIAANKRAESTYQYKIDELCTMKISELNVLQNNHIKKEMANANNRLRHFFHFPHKTANGEILNMEVESHPTTIDNKPCLLSIINHGNIQNIFPYSNIKNIQNINKAAIILDHENRIIKVNKFFESFFKIRLIDIIGKNYQDILKDIPKDNFMPFQKELNNGKSSKISFTTLVKNKPHKLSLNGYPSFFKNNYFGTLLVIDLTKEDDCCQELEQKVFDLEKSNLQKEDFLARMSHDMRTPMNAILSFANFGLDEIKDPKALKYFSQIKDSSDYLLSLINDILDMQKLESGKIYLQEVVTYTPKIANKIKTIIKPRAAQKGIDLKFKLRCENLYSYIKADERRIEQILINILNNAIKYTPKGGCVVWTDTFEKLPNGKIKVSHIISDNGVGMSEDFQKRMFTPFSTEINELSNIEGGTGLGLAITKNLVEAMGGKISCKSKLNVGTTFFIDLFLNQAPTNEVEQFLKKNDTELTKHILKGKKILLCEDVEINCIIVKKLLDVYKCEVDVAKNGKEGIALANKNKYALILMDIRMPVMNGLEATIEIRKNDKTTPIIALSANAYPKDIEKSLNVGMNAHLAKPIIREQLYSILTELLN